MKYYSIVISAGYVLLKLLLNNLEVSGILYAFFTCAFLIFHAVILIRYRKILKYKALSTIIAFFSIVISTDMIALLYTFSNFMLYVGISLIDEKLYLKIISFVLCALLIVCPFFILLPVFVVLLRSSNDVYEDTHYYCEGHYEVYAYSAGAMDKFHYSIGKRYEFIDIGGIIRITYRIRNEKTREEYQNFLERHECWKVGENDGFK